MTDQDPAPKLTGAFDLFTKSKDAVLKNFKLFAILYAVPLLFTLWGMFVTPKAQNANYDAALGISSASTATDISVSKASAVVGGVVAVIVVAVLLAGLYQAMLHRLELSAADNKQPSFSDLWAAAKKFWVRLILLSITVALMIFGGLILLIVPGIIMIRRYFLAPYVLIDQDVSVREAMKRSAAMSKPYSGSIWRILGVICLISLVGIVPVVGSLVSFILATLYSVAPALRYYELKHLSTTA